jgi:ABC-2 type transport system ATP-binding protein
LNPPVTEIPSLIAARPPAVPFIIETNRLGKNYGTQRALVDVTVQVPCGTVGLLGPNGAGKSTFIKCLLNLETPSAGTARVLGRDIRAANRASREKVGYSPEQDCHISGMAGCEYVTYCGQLSGMPMRAARQRTHEILDLVGMGQERYRPVDTYSTGMRQRVKLAQALVHDPELVFLDEPTNGLDPSGREHILKLIGSLWRDLGISVVMSSHLLRDIERVCDRVIIISNGRMLEHDSIVALKNRHRRIVELTPSADRDRFVHALEGAGARVTRLSNGRLRVESQSDSIEWILQLMRVHHLPPAEIVANPDALHELFIKSISADGSGAEESAAASENGPNPSKLSGTSMVEDELSRSDSASRAAPRQSADRPAQPPLLRGQVNDTGDSDHGRQP